MAFMASGRDRRRLSGGRTDGRRVRSRGNEVAAEEIAIWVIVWRCLASRRRDDLARRRNAKDRMTAHNRLDLRRVPTSRLVTTISYLFAAQHSGGVGQGVPLNRKFSPFLPRRWVQINFA